MQQVLKNTSAFLRRCYYLSINTWNCETTFLITFKTKIKNPGFPLRQILPCLYTFFNMIIRKIENIILSAMVPYVFSWSLGTAFLIGKY